MDPAGSGAAFENSFTLVATPSKAVAVAPHWEAGKI